jgi:hypothetical protein
VVITGWSDARIPWPRCRALDSPGGGSSLLVEEELARAVRHEAAAAVMFWWGASQRAVWAWRKALGVTRTGNEGTARLVLAAAGQGAEAVKAREWTDQERERRRQVNAAKGLARNLVTGYHGPLWTPQDIARLGTVPDVKVARRTGRTLTIGAADGRCPAPATACAGRPWNATSPARPSNWSGCAPRASDAAGLGKRPPRSRRGLAVRRVVWRPGAYGTADP